MLSTSLQWAALARRRLPSLMDHVEAMTGADPSDAFNDGKNHFDAALSGMFTSRPSRMWRWLGAFVMMLIILTVASSTPTIADRIDSFVSDQLGAAAF